MLYSITLNDKPGRGPQGEESVGLSRTDALESAVDLIRSLCSGDRLGYCRWYPDLDNTNESILVYHHGGVDVIDVREQ